MGNYTFIQATRDDFDILLQLRLLTMVSHLEKAGLFLSEDEHRARVDEAFFSTRLIFKQQKIVGMLKYLEESKRFYIMQLQIFPCWQNKGVGQEVLTQFIQARQNKPIELTVLKDNPAKHLYLRLGFTITGEDEHEYFMLFS